MDRFKEKVNALKVERDVAVALHETLKVELKTAQEELAIKDDQHSSLTKKVCDLETDLDEALKNLKETTEKHREMDIKVENQARTIAKLEDELSGKDKKLEEQQKKYDELKNEYDETVKNIDDI